MKVSNLNVPSIVRVLLEKCLAPGKPQIKKYSNEILFLLFEKSDV